MNPSPKELRVLMYQEERAAMRAEAKRIFASLDAMFKDPTPRTVGTHTVPAGIKHEVIGRFDSPFKAR